MSDLFSLKNEIPEKFKTLYEELQRNLYDEGDLNSSIPTDFNSIDSKSELVSSYNDALLLLLSEKEGEIAIISEMQRSLSERKSRLQASEQRIRDTIMYLLNIAREDKVQSAFGTSYRIRTPLGHLEIEDEEKFLQENPGYIKITSKLDKRSVLDDLKQGVVIPGARALDKESIGVRR